MATETPTAPDQEAGVSVAEHINGGESFYRAANPSELSFRSESEAQPVMEGRMMPYNDWTEVRSKAEGHFMERFAPGSLAKTISEQSDKIRALFEHGLDPRLGRQPIAAIEEMHEDADGAYFRASLLEGIPNLILSGLRRGLYGSSVRFNPVKWDRVRSPRTSDFNPHGLEERTIREGSMREFSLTAFPVYANTTARIRSITEEIEIGRYRDDPGHLADVIEHVLRSVDMEPEPAEATTPPTEAEPATATRAEPGAAVTKPQFSTRKEWLEWISKTSNRLRSVEDLASYQTEVESRIAALNTEFDGLPFTDEARSEYAALREQHSDIDARVAELKARARDLEAFGQRTENREIVSFNTARPSTTRGDDIYDLSTIRSNLMDPSGAAGELSDRAMRSVETSKFPSDRRAGYNQEDLRERVEGLLDKSSQDGEVAKRILLTGSPTYRRAFGKAIAGRARTREEDEALSRAASLTTTAGGFAVPYTLDPTVILTNSGAINPVRGIANVITITGNTWNGVSSAGITASYDGEGVEVSDDTPVLAQPTANVEMARAFVPFSIEIGEDWGSFQSEMSRLFSDAKDILESSKFLTGLGHASIQPEGLLVGATGTRQTATASVFAVADLYAVENDLSPRWRARALFTGSKAAYQKIRQFDTGGGASLWTQLQFGNPADLIGYPAYEWSDYSSAVTTPNSSVLTFGDFNQFTIIDRVGMSVELVPHIFGTFWPTGQRGLFAYWRNTSDVTVSTAFKTIRIS